MKMCENLKGIVAHSSFHAESHSTSQELAWPGVCCGKNSSYYPFTVFSGNAHVCFLFTENCFPTD